MRIALDATPLTVPTGGIRRYTAELSRALTNLELGDSIYLLSDAPFSAPAGVHTVPQPQGVLDQRWWAYGLPRQLKNLGIQLFHGTDFAVPLQRTLPAVMTVHDLSPWKETAWRAASSRVRRRTPWLLRLGFASLVITPSEAIRREAIGFFGLSEDKVVAVPLAAGPEFHPLTLPPAEPPYLLAVGSLEPRKNLTALIELWRTLRTELPLRLRLVGRPRDSACQVAPEPGLEWLGAVDDSALPALYSQALAFVFPSLYEGFGLPLLEAMQCGAPVLTSNDPALRELGNTAPVAGRLEDWPEAIRHLHANPDLRKHWANQSLKRAAGFSWVRTARLTRDVYTEALARHG